MILIVGTDQKIRDNFVFARSPYSSLRLCGTYMCQILKTDSIDRIVLKQIKFFHWIWSSFTMMSIQSIPSFPMVLSKNSVLKIYPAYFTYFISWIFKVVCSSTWIFLCHELKSSYPWPHDISSSSWERRWIKLCKNIYMTCWWWQLRKWKHFFILIRNFKFDFENHCWM